MAKVTRKLAQDIVLCFAAAFMALATVQPSAATTYLPSVKIGTAALISPGSANTFYGSNTVSSDGLSTYSGVETPTPIEVVELARALKNDPDLIYQYVHNNIQNTWLYGLQKGALGTEIDKSGTDFDQAVLMVALLRQSGLPASYIAGTIQLSQTQFYAWTGITNARAACQLLANGGIPASVQINNTTWYTNTTCGQVPSSDLSNVEMAHVWVQVTITNSHSAGCDPTDNCIFDPSYKPYTWKPGINLATAMSFTSGDPLGAAMVNANTGTTSGAPWVNTLNASNLNSKLQTYGSNLLSYIQNNNLQGAQIEDIISGGIISPDYSVVRQANLPYIDPSPPYQKYTWPAPSDAARYNAIPNQYRTKLEVNGFTWKAHSGTPDPHCTTVSSTYEDCSMFDPTFYVDETYGRALTVETDYTQDGIQNGPNQCGGGVPAYKAICNEYHNRVTLELDNAPLANLPTFDNPPVSTNTTSRELPSHITLVATHPYAATSDPNSTAATGGYMSETMDKPVTLITSIAIVNGWGDSSATMFNKWSDERAQETELPQPVVPRYCFGTTSEECPPDFFQPAGNYGRLKAAAGWLAQTTRAARLNAAIANSVPQLHHALGVLYADNNLTATYGQGPQLPPDVVENDSFDRLDVDSAISFTSKVADSTARRAAIQSFVTASAALEGSMSGQLADAPDTESTATRFEWGNAPPPDVTGVTFQNPRGLGSQNFYLFNSGDVSVAQSTITSEGYVVHLENLANTLCPVNDGVANWGSNPDQPEISRTECESWGSALDSELLNYTGAGFQVVTSQESFLGPGQRGGAIYPYSMGCGSIPCNYTHDRGKQRGGAFIATKYDANGDPTEIAHIVISVTVNAAGTVPTKGGGSGASEPDTRTNYNPSEAADILKARFVDRSNALGVNLSNGSLSYKSPLSLSVGNGGFPYELTGSFDWQPGIGDTSAFGLVAGSDPQPGWKLNWLNKLTMSGSGMEAMGQSDIRAALGAIVAFYSAQDIYKSSPTVQRDAAATLAHAWWIHQTQGNVVTVAMGADSRQFIQLFNGSWILPGSGYATLAQTGARTRYEQECATGTQITPYALALGWDYHNVSFTVTNQHGDQENFGYYLQPYGLAGDQLSCGQLKGFRLASWTFPYGPSVTPAYSNTVLTEVDNSVGRKIKITLPSLNAAGSLTNGILGADARSITLGQFNPLIAGWPSMSDALSNTTTFAYIPAQATTPAHRPIPYSLLQTVTTPDSTQANVQYDYDSEGRIMDVYDAVAIQKGTRGPYFFYLADGTRGERDDPLNQPYTVVYDTYGHPSQYIDEMGFTTNALFDSRTRPMHYLYPEGDCDVLAYDDRNNTTDYWRVDRTVSTSCDTTAGSTHVLHASAQWNEPVWNKPTSVTNARGYATTLTYYGSANGKSLLHTATRPAITEGTAIYAFAYTSIGKLDTSTGPLPSNIVTKNNYDASANLTSTILDFGTGTHLNLTTAFGYNTTGDRTSVTDPRNFITTSIFDADGRKTEDDHHTVAGDPNSLLNAVERIQYDVLGRDKEDDQAQCFDNPATCPGTGTTVVTWVAVKKTTYTPTSKVNTVTDADNRTTTNTWDDDDRISTIADPLVRKVHYVYCAPGDATCAANQVKWEYHAWTTGFACSRTPPDLQQCYKRVTYLPDGEENTVKDDRNNVTTYCYDGFVRQVETDFPDSTGTLCQTASDYEHLTLDENGNITQRRNRAGEVLTYQYNALDWMTQKCMPTTGMSCPANPAVTTNWAYLLDGRIDTLSDTAGNLIDYGYDSAGRQNGVTTTIPGAFAAVPQTVTYALDAFGNRVSLTWPDAFVAGYCYDNLNRMTFAVKSPANPTNPDCANTAKFATYTYDTLSRRTNVTYGFGSKMDYTYSPAGDLQTLNHTMVGSTPQYTFQYTNAHQLSSEAISDSSYAWQPGANATDTYAAVNKLNQYPSWTPAGGSSIPFTYDGKANLTGGTIGGGAWAFNYDAENRLLTADKTVGGTVHAAYAYDPLGRRTHKSGTGVTETYFLSDGTDEIFEYNSAGTTTRRIVPGPAIDEPIVQGSGTGLGTYRYFHTNHQGSVIGTVGSSGGLFEGPYTYDPYGNCYSGASACTLVSGGTSYRFTGRRFDPETGLLYYRARYYSPVIGRFLQTDPVGYKADLNLYTYAGNDPTDRNDPLGSVSPPAGECGVTAEPVSCSSGPTVGGGGGSPGGDSKRSRAKGAHFAGRDMSRESGFVRAHYSDAQKLAKDLGKGSTADDFLALGSIESLWGTSNAAQLANNYFGVHNVGSGPFSGQTGTYITSGIDGVQGRLVDGWIPPFSPRSPQQAVAAFPAVNGFYLSGSVVVRSLQKVSGSFASARDFGIAVHVASWAQGYSQSTYANTFQRRNEIIEELEQ